MRAKVLATQGCRGPREGAGLLSGCKQGINRGLAHSCRWDDWAYEAFRNRGGTAANGGLLRSTSDTVTLRLRLFETDRIVGIEAQGAPGTVDGTISHRLG